MDRSSSYCPLCYMKDLNRESSNVSGIEAAPSQFEVPKTDNGLK